MMHLSTRGNTILDVRQRDTKPQRHVIADIVLESLDEHFLLLLGQFFEWLAVQRFTEKIDETEDTEIRPPLALPGIFVFE